MPKITQVVLTPAQQKLANTCQLVANAYAELCNERFGTKLPVPYKLNFNLCLLDPRAAGIAFGRRLKDGTAVGINHILMEDDPQDMLNDTIQHEIAHQVCNQLYPGRRIGHGLEWRNVMKSLGYVKPKATHSLNLSRAIAFFEANGGKLKKRRKRKNGTS